MLDLGDVLRVDSANANDMEHLHPWFDAVAQYLPHAVQHGMRVALEEAVVNAAMHGFPPNGSGQITVRLRISPGFVALVVEDSGRAFDPTVPPVPWQPANL